MTPWDEQEFGSLFSVPLRNGITCPAAARGSGVQLINMGEIFGYDRIGDLPAERAPLPPRNGDEWLLREGDLLFARQSLKYEGAGKVSIVLAADEPRTWEGHLIRVRLDPDKSDARFYYYLFRSPDGRERMETIIEQVAAAGIRGSDLRTLLVPVPPHSEQAAIAEVLAALDDKCDSNRTLAQLAEEFIRTAYEAESQEFVPLSELATVKRDLVDPRTRGEDMVDLFSIPAYDAGPAPERVPASAIKSGKFRVTPGDVLVSRLNPRTPRIWLPDVRHEPAVCSTEFLVLTPRPHTTASDLWAACWCPDARVEMTLRATGTSGSHQRVHPDDAMTVAVLDPRVVSTRTRTVARDLLARAAAARTETATLENTRDELLPMLLAQTVRPRAELKAART